jgi:hypothetical protein
MDRLGWCRRKTDSYPSSVTFTREEPLASGADLNDAGVPG